MDQYIEDFCKNEEEISQNNFNNNETKKNDEKEDQTEDKNFVKAYLKVIRNLKDEEKKKHVNGRSFHFLGKLFNW